MCSVSLKIKVPEQGLRDLQRLAVHGQERPVDVPERAPRDPRVQFEPEARNPSLLPQPSPSSPALPSGIYLHKFTGFTSLSFFL
jgi:hypothetical protein